MKNKILDNKKLWEMLEKNVLIIFILIIVISFSALDSLEALHFRNNDLSSIRNTLSDTKQKLEVTNKSGDNLSDVSWITYELWLNEFAAPQNSNIYNNTASLGLLPKMSQDDLNKISLDNNPLTQQQNYNNLVKFIIIDKSNHTFFTNDTSSIEFLKNNLKLLSVENGELYKYISNIGKWYNISYTSEGSPAHVRYNKENVENPNNFIEAYWFPKSYNYLVEDEVILKNTLNKVRNDYQSIIDSNNISIVNVQNSIVKYKVLVSTYFILILLMMSTLYFLGKERILHGIKRSFVVKIIQAINGWFGRRSTLFKMAVFLLSTFSALFMPVILVIGYDLSGMLLILFLPWILFYLTAILPNIIMFSKYIDEITNGIDKITSGDLDYFIAEKWDRSLSTLAHNINKLNKGFKVSIEEQIKNEKLKSELVANVSHDLKTPLTSIINYADILIREDTSEEEKKEYLNILHRKSLKLKSLIEDLFEISKINSGKLDLNMETVDVVELVEQSIAEYSDLEVYNSKNLSFIFRPYTKKIEMTLDGKKLSRVFENLINNALKYSLNNTRVFIEIEDISETKNNKTSIKISFKNISSTALDFNKEHIFERFTRGDTSRNSNIDGSGLGLAIAKSIVELHDGRMYIDFDGDMFKVIIEI